MAAPASGAPEAAVPVMVSVAAGAGAGDGAGAGEGPGAGDGDGDGAGEGAGPGAGAGPGDGAGAGTVPESVAPGEPPPPPPQAASSRADSPAKAHARARAAARFDRIATARTSLARWSAPTCPGCSCRTREDSLPGDCPTPFDGVCSTCGVMNRTAGPSQENRLTRSGRPGSSAVARLSLLHATVAPSRIASPATRTGTRIRWAEKQCSKGGAMRCAPAPARWRG